MFFRVQNLGPLRDAEIDLSKDLIVLAGPNNSGKTYLAWSVYGLHRTRFEMDTPPVVQRWAQALWEAVDHSIDFNDLFAREGQEMLAAISSVYSSKLHLCFAAVNEQFADTAVSIRSEFHGFEASESRLAGLLALSRYNHLRLLWTATGAKPRLSFVLLNPAVPGPRFADMLQEGQDVEAVWGPATTLLVHGMSAIEREMAPEGIALLLRMQLAGILFPNSVIFPAERIALNLFAKELTLKRNALVDEMVDADLDEQPGKPLELIRRKAGRYPWPIRDGLRVASDLANLSKEKTIFADLADELERAILGGTVSISEEGEFLYSPEAATGSRLAIHLTASVVKSLTSLVFYFRHLAKKGDFLIIDEPELNLHPDNQRKIARILAKAVRRGFKVMISTHSDYVLRELNHLIMLNKLPAEEATELGYDPEFALDPAKVGVYLVDDHRAESIPIEETGFSIKTIDAVVNQLNLDEQRLYARIAG
jgi:AAA ATPase domain